MCPVVIKFLSTGQILQQLESNFYIGTIQRSFHPLKTQKKKKKKKKNAVLTLRGGSGPINPPDWAIRQSRARGLTWACRFHPQACGFPSALSKPQRGSLKTRHACTIRLGRLHQPRRGCKTHASFFILRMETNPASPKKPWNDDSPLNSKTPMISYGFKVVV